MTPVNFLNRSLISYALCKRQSRACGMRSFRWRFGMEESQQIPVIIEQTAAEQRTSCRLKEPDCAVCFVFIDSYGRGGGVGRGLGVSAGLGVGEGLGVEVGVAVAVAVLVLLSL